MSDKSGIEGRAAKDSFEEEHILRVETILASRVEPIEALIPTEEDIKVVKEASRLVKDTFGRYEVEVPSEVPEILLARDGKLRIVGNKNRESVLSVEGIYIPYGRHRIILNDKLQKDHKLMKHVGAHELTHRASELPIRLIHTDRGAIFIHQSGLHRFRYDSDLEISGNYFFGVSEAITEKIALEAVGEGNDTHYYGLARVVLDDVLDGLSEGNTVRRNGLWQQAVRGYPRGNYAFLNQLDRHFGPGSLKLLARCGAMPPAGAKLGLGMQDLNISAYFSSGTPEDKRTQIRNKVLTSY